MTKSKEITMAAPPAPKEVTAGTNGNGNGHKPSDIVFYEHGTSGLKQYGGFVTQAYNTALYWPQVGMLYHRLLTSDPPVVMTARAFTSWSRQISPKVDLPEKPSDDDKRYQEYMYSVMADMEGGFGRYAESNFSTTPFYGFNIWNAPLGRRDPNWTPPAFVDQNGKAWPDDWRSEYNDGLIGIRRLAPRSPLTFDHWEFDGRKQAIGMWQRDYPMPLTMIKLAECLHHTFGDPSNPEGNTPLQAAWRLERLRYGYEVVMGIGSEHAAGHFKVTKTEQGDISDGDEARIQAAAKAVMTAQEGNYVALPYGWTGELMDVPFAAGALILDIVKYYTLVELAVYTMGWMGMNLFTSTGALASQSDMTNAATFTFNSMVDGFAAQFDAQIGKRLWNLNKQEFPGITKRPIITFSHITRDIALQEVGNFLTSIKDIVPLGRDDQIAIRERSDFLPKNPPPDAELPAQPTPPTPPDNTLPSVNTDNTNQPTPADVTKQAINQALAIYRAQDESTDI